MLISTAMPDAYVVTQRVFARIIGRSEEWIRKLSAAGMPSVRSGRHGSAVKIDCPAAIAWLLAQERAKYDTAGDGNGLAGATQRLRQSQAELAELELATRRGELCALSDFQRSINEAMGILASQLESLPARLASQLAAMNDPAEVRQHLAVEVRRIRGAIADSLKEWATAIAEGDGPKPTT